MIRRASENKSYELPHFLNGKGTLEMLDIRLPEEMKPNGRKYALVTIPAGASLGYHVHKGDAETYYILSGRGVYNENGTLVDVSAGDMMYCPDGEGHGIENNSDEPIQMLALILYTLK